jgi:hypothetical protein
MRYPVSEKLQIIWLDERSSLPVCRNLEKLSVPHNLLPLVPSLQQGKTRSRQQAAEELSVRSDLSMRDAILSLKL